MMVVRGNFEANSAPPIRANFLVAVLWLMRIAHDNNQHTEISLVGLVR